MPRAKKPIPKPVAPPPLPPPQPEDLAAILPEEADPTQAPPEAPRGTAWVVDRAVKLAGELASRRLEALSIYEPMLSQELFHRSTVRNRLARGSNRSGKTNATMVEVARAVTGRDPYGKYPARDGVAYVVGKDEKHLAKVIYRKLFKAGAFKIIRDETTGAWRTYRHWADHERRQEAKPAPPLIPPRMISEIGWYDKKLQVPSVCRLRSGWEIHFFSSLGKPQKGSDIDLFVFDEEIVDPEWVPEMAARIVDRRGRGIWSFTPEEGTDQAFELHERAEKERATLPPEKRSIEEFEFLLADNPHLDDEQKRALAQDLTEEQRRVKIGGEYAILGYRVYPTFSMSVHGYPVGEVAPHWTRYAYVDPGYRTCAVLFAAVPPPDVGDFVLLYDELYLHEATADSFALAMKKACEGGAMQAFLIDMHMALHTELGVGKNVLEQYSAALAHHGVRSVSTGSGFLFASDDKMAGILAVQGMLRVRQDGTPRLRVMREKLPAFEREIRTYHRKRIAGEVRNEPDNRKDNHLMDCYSEDMEILTNNGWKLFSDLTDSEQVATVNLETDLIEYQVPTEIIRRQHSGEMIKFGGHKLDALVTPNHRMVVYPKKGYAGYDGGRPVVKLAKDVSVWDSIKLHARWEGHDPLSVIVPAAGRLGRERILDATDWAELLGWYVSEGCRAQKIQMPGRGYQVVISQTKPEGKEKLRALLARTPWNWAEFERGFRASDRGLWEALGECGDGAANKCVPLFILDASPRLIEAFINAAVAGDGWVQAGRRSYATISATLADQMQELFLKIGRSASVRRRPPGECRLRGVCSTNTKEQFWVSEWTCPHGGLRNKDNKPNFSSAQYDGMVYCVSVPNGTLIVRRNGRPMVCGNCLRYMALHDPRYVKRQQGAPAVGEAMRAFRRKLDRQREAQGGGYVNLGPGKGGGKW